MENYTEGSEKAWDGFVEGFTRFQVDVDVSLSPTEKTGHQNSATNLLQEPCTIAQSRPIQGDGFPRAPIQRRTDFAWRSEHPHNSSLHLDNENPLAARPNATPQLVGLAPDVVDEPSER